jgi:hypothetical protein
MGFLDSVSTKELEEAEEYSGFSQFPVGENEAAISGVQEKTSSTGKPMLEITFINGTGAQIRHYIVDGEYKLRNLKSFYNAFKIPLEEKNTNRWLGKRGIVVVKEGDEYNGVRYNKVSYLKSLPQAPKQNNPPPPQQNPGQKHAAPAQPAGFNPWGD